MNKFEKITPDRNARPATATLAVIHPPAEVKADAVPAIALEDLCKTYGSLSAGQKTRVAVAKALSNDPEVLLLDEPTASLDPDRAEWVRSHLRAYQARRGATILLSSHNMPDVKAMCASVVFTRRRRVAPML